MVVVGASAGGIDALRTLVAGLPVDLRAAVLVVLHVPQGSPSALAGILDRSGPLPAATVTDSEPLAPGAVRVAPEGHHLLLRDGALHTSRGPRENGYRPAVDVLFRSAATEAGPRVVAVVLSGALDDGTAGLAAVRAHGGVAVVQDPDDAMYPGMPRSAIEMVGADHVAPVADIARLVGRLTTEPHGPAPAQAGGLADTESAVADLGPEVLSGPTTPGVAAGYSCPDCAGTLFRLEEGGIVRFRCRVGHAWSAATLLEQQGAVHEQALWMAMRSLEERAALTYDLGERARSRGHELSAARFADQSHRARGAAEVLRHMFAEPHAQPGPAAAAAQPALTGDPARTSGAG